MKVMDKEIYHQIQRIEQSHWWYVARRKIIFDWARQIISGCDSPQILDVGCGTGFNLEYLHNFGCMSAIGLDFSIEALTLCQERKLRYLVCGDALQPPFRSGSFDLILALDLIEHLEDDRHALQALGYLLKPGGYLLIFTPALNFLWSWQDEVGHHYRRYTAAELRGKLCDTGFRIQKVTYANTFLFPLIASARLALKIFGRPGNATSENDLHPGWSNNLLQAIFAAERPLLRYFSFPIGVSLLCVARKLS
jgi:SAM-dependent methyltransferase